MVNTSMRLTEPSFSALFSMRRDIGSRSCAQSRTAETRLSAPPSNWFGVSCRTATPEKSRRRTPESDDDEEEDDADEGESCVNASSSSLRRCQFVSRRSRSCAHRHLYRTKRRRHDERRVALDDDLQALDPERFFVVEGQGGVGEVKCSVILQRDFNRVAVHAFADRAQRVAVARRRARDDPVSAPAEGPVRLEAAASERRGSCREEAEC